MTTYRYLGKDYSREELRRVVEAQAATLDDSQWQDGEFRFDEWLSDSIVTGTVSKADTDLNV